MSPRGAAPVFRCLRCKRRGSEEGYGRVRLDQHQERNTQGGPGLGKRKQELTLFPTSEEVRSGLKHQIRVCHFFRWVYCMNEEEIIERLDRIEKQQALHFQEWQRAREEAIRLQSRSFRQVRIIGVFAGVVILIIFALPWILRDDVPVTGQPVLFPALGIREEASEWLKANRNPYAFASNRFGETENAVAFVKKLYDGGAKKVYVTNIMDEQQRIREEGGPYADSLIVVLPEDQEKRAGLFRISATEAEREGLDPDVDVGQKELFLWWD